MHSPWQEIVLHQHVKHDMSFKKTASEMSTLFVLIFIIFIVKLFNIYSSSMFNGYIIEFCQKTHALSNSSKMYILKKIYFLNNLILLKNK